MFFLKVTVFTWLLICIYYNRKLGFQGRKNNPLIVGTMPYLFLAIMIYSGITLNDYKMLNVAILGVEVVIISTVYAIYKIKKFYFPVNGS